MGRTRNKQEKKKSSTHLDTSELLPTGSTLLNLACSDTPYGGPALKRITHIVGDSSAGKTFLAYSIFAECAHKKRFDSHKLIDDDAEAANSFNVAKLFGKRTADRVGEPENGCSNTVQDFLLNVKAELDKELPFIYVLDSFDALTSDEDTSKINELEEARKKGTKEKGSFGMQKPKLASQMFRMIKKRLKETNSALIILSQTRDDINPMTFSTKTHSGGRALKFYASHQMWLAVGKKHKEKGLPSGIDCITKITKNKLTGKIREVKFPIFYSYGIDDITSCIDFLLATGRAKKIKNSIKMPSSIFKGDPMVIKKIVQRIEDHGLEKLLRKEVASAWHELEEAIVLDRRSKYE